METKETLSFEEAMENLEDIVTQLEQGDVPLEQAITHYQNGMKLSKICNEKLVNVQDKMTQIMNEQGELETFAIQDQEEE